MSTEVLKQLVEALEYISSHYMSLPHNASMALAAGRQALEQQPAGEPVAIVTSENNPVTMSWWHEPALPVGTELYTRPQPAAQWVGLTDEEISQIEDEYIVDFRIPAGCSWNFAKHIEAELRKKNAA